MDGTCYCCNNPSTGQGDHVPAKSLFPKGSFATIKPIIVPSCLEHNESQSKADEYLKFIMLASTGYSAGGMLRKSADSIVRLVQIGARKLERYGVEVSPEEIVHYQASAPVDEPLLEQALTKIARGLYYHHHDGKRKLLGDVSVCQLFLGIEDSAPSDVRSEYAKRLKLAKHDLTHFKTEGTHPEIFAYQLFEGPESRHVTVNMVFYGKNVASVMKLDA